MDMLAVGNEVTVEFDAIGDVLYSGCVIQVDPTLVTEEGVQVIRGLVALDESATALPEGLPLGLRATVDVIAGKAENAVLVPIEALRDLGDGQYAVFVMEDAEPKLRQIEVGLQDYTYAEVVSGLEAGETVTTGIVEVK
jgi:multidrug efflux pump subunit AcrA (membrane-fusion protein)